MNGLMNDQVNIFRIINVFYDYEQIYTTIWFQYIGQLAVFCEQVYKSNSPNERRQAENVLNEFMSAPDALEKCIHVLKRLVICC